jgi:hypothetical protein
LLLEIECCRRPKTDQLGVRHKPVQDLCRTPGSQVWIEINKYTDECHHKQTILVFATATEIGDAPNQGAARSARDRRFRIGCAVRRGDQAFQ